MQAKINEFSNTKLVYKHKLRTSEIRGLWLSRITIWIVMLIILFPIFSVVSASFNKGDTFFNTHLLPQQLTFENYTNVLNKTDFKIWVKNSMIMCISVAMIQLCITVTAAYAFSRMKFKGRSKGLMALLILQMFPSSMALPAILGICYKLGLIDQFGALILLLSGGSAFSIWLLKGFMDSLPRELDEAAMVDGASHWKIFYKIILPLCKPMLAVTFLFSVVGNYSEFIYTSALMKDSAKQTVATGLRSFINNQFSANWTQYSAASVMATIPIAIMFMLLQKFIASGLTAGAVKG